MYYLYKLPSNYRAKGTGIRLSDTAKGVLSKDIPWKSCSKNFRLVHWKTFASSLQPLTLLRKRLHHRCFPVTSARIYRAAFF